MVLILRGTSRRDESEYARTIDHTLQHSSLEGAAAAVVAALAGGPSGHPAVDVVAAASALGQQRGRRHRAKTAMPTSRRAQRRRIALDEVVARNATMPKISAKR